LASQQGIVLCQLLYQLMLAKALALNLFGILFQMLARSQSKAVKTSLQRSPDN
jgi:hypothetical protein